MIKEYDIDKYTATLCQKCYNDLLNRLGIKEVEQITICGVFFPCEQCGKRDTSYAIIPRHYTEEHASN